LDFNGNRKQVTQTCKASVKQYKVRHEDGCIGWKQIKAFRWQWKVSYSKYKWQIL
jgi:hypothetical protein